MAEYTVYAAGLPEVEASAIAVQELIGTVPSGFCPSCAAPVIVPLLVEPL